MAYAGTMQENCLRLMGKKLLVSLAMEGKFANHGLQALDDDDDMLTAMARELVTQKGVGEKADACWREVQREHTRVLEAQRVSRSRTTARLGSNVGGRRRSSGCTRVSRTNWGAC